MSERPHKLTMWSTGRQLRCAPLAPITTGVKCQKEFACTPDPGLMTTLFGDRKSLENFGLMMGSSGAPTIRASDG